MNASDRELLTALQANGRSPRILDIHLDDCESAACTGCEPRHLEQKADAYRAEIRAQVLAEVARLLASDTTTPAPLLIDRLRVEGGVR
ncbi:hypothetical protein [Streptomyces sp. cmx-4-9]|uniref:hypothetical protein n=1 Tax=Streptomyces sp. cmx-4-9 TaxID=2790941 RepID=UPI0039818B9F